ncbi:MAG: SAF domain-containing protein [Acidimicrobiales bacterium]
MEATTIMSRGSSAEIHAIRRHRPLPGSRAVLGGFLVTVAAVGLFVAYTRASATNRMAFVVATRSLGPGHRIVASDLTTMAMSLPPQMERSLAFRQPADLVGSVIVAPLRPGELVQVSDVVKAGGPGAPVRLMSFSLPLSRAVDGNLSIGDLVDVLVTFGTGTQAETSVVAAGIPVVGINGTSGGFGSAADRSLVITLGVNRPGDVVSLVQASNAGQVVLVRSTGASSQDYQSTPTSASTAPPVAPATIGATH